MGDEFLCLMEDIGLGDAEGIYQQTLVKYRFRKMGGHTIPISVDLAEHSAADRAWRS